MKSVGQNRVASILKSYLFPQVIYSHKAKGDKSANNLNKGHNPC